MLDFNLNDFIIYYRSIESTERTMRNIMLQNLEPICRGCIRQPQCWKQDNDFEDLCIYDNDKCMNHIK
jgi:hypothetical protein